MTLTEIETYFQGLCKDENIMATWQVKTNKRIKSTRARVWYNKKLM